MKNAGKKLPPGVTKRKDGRYCGRYTDRYGKRLCVYGKTANETYRKLKEAKTEERPRDKITVNDWHRTWERTYVSELSKSAQTTYESAYRRHIRPILGYQQIDRVKPMDVKEVLIRMANKDMSQSMVAFVKQIMSGMFRAAEENGYIVSNPARFVKLPKARASVSNRALTISEQNLLVSECERSPYGNFIKAQLSSGLRCGELAAIGVGDLDFNRKVINVNQTLGYYTENSKSKLYIHSPKTKCSIRTIPMTDMFAKAVESELKTRSEIPTRLKGTEFEKCIFRSTRGYPITTNTLNAALKRLVDEINALGGEQIGYFSTHSLRHTFCTRMIEQNANIKIVQHIMGHSNISVTMQVYAHVQDDFVESARKEIGNLF